MSPSTKKLANHLTDHLFRNFYQEVFSSLVVKFGTTHIDLIEDALQDTFYKALKSWSFNKHPDRPKDWLFIVTRNTIINELRRSAKLVNHEFVGSRFDSVQINPESAKDDQLQLLLACSKFAVKPRAKLIFTLKAICGFGVTEIANGLQLKEDNVYRIGQRTQQKLKELPEGYFKTAAYSKITGKDVEYLGQIIYFMFNEGYDSINKSSKTGINKDICFEALRLAHLLEENHLSASIKNLLALFYLLMARFDSRLNEEGEFVSLRQQDRTKWDDDLIQLGFNYLTKPDALNRYYIEALIASLHSTSPSFKETDWQQILKLYDALLLLQDTAIIRLNRAICLFELGNYSKGKKALDEIKDQLEDSYVYYSVSMAEYLSDKDKKMSIYWYKKSLESTKQTFRKQLIQNKLNELK